jgi:hypothetical protein
VVHVDHVDDLTGFVDPIPNPVLATPGPPLTLEWPPKLCAGPVRILCQRAEDELDASSCYRLGKVFS